LDLLIGVLSAFGLLAYIQNGLRSILAHVILNHILDGWYLRINGLLTLDSVRRVRSIVLGLLIDLINWLIKRDHLDVTMTSIILLKRMLNDVYHLVLMHIIILRHLIRLIDNDWRLSGLLLNGSTLS
jgi:hypothetical protein